MSEVKIIKPATYYLEGQRTFKSTSDHFVKTYFIIIIVMIKETLQSYS